jgi:hypothetical protein
MAETPDLLLLVQTVGGHLHTSINQKLSNQRCSVFQRATKGSVPDRDHVVVHLLELLLGGLQSVWGRVELVGLEALVRETDGEWLVILLMKRKQYRQHWVPGAFRRYIPVFRIGSTNLRDRALGLRGGGVGSDSATGKRSESLTPQRRSLAGCSTEEHDGRNWRWYGLEDSTLAKCWDTPKIFVHVTSFPLCLTGRRRPTWNSENTP